MRVAGHVLRARTLFIRRHSEDAWPKVLGALPDITREVASAGFLEPRWYPYDMLIDISATADRVLGKGDMALCHQMGRFSCDYTLTTVHRLLLKFGNIGHLVDRSATAWRRQFDTGEVIVHVKNPDHYVFEVRGVPRPHRAHCASITGWMERAAEISGEDEFQWVETCRAWGDERCSWSFTRNELDFSQ